MTQLSHGKGQAFGTAVKLPPGTSMSHAAVPGLQAQLCSHSNLLLICPLGNGSRTWVAASCMGDSG